MLAGYPGPGHEAYPYLLRGVSVEHVDQFWSTDITYLPLEGGHIDLHAVIDWRSRYLISWSLSCSMDGPCARSRRRPSFNSARGLQYRPKTPVHHPGEEITDRDVTVSMDARGRALDNVFAERLWRILKYENFYIKGYSTIAELKAGLKSYFEFYNYRRRTPRSTAGLPQRSTLGTKRSLGTPQRRRSKRKDQPMQKQPSKKAS